MAWMAQMPSAGYRTWVCACGRLGVALAVEACPDCGQPQPGAPEASAPPPEPAPARRQPSAQARRTRTRTTKGATHG